MGFIHEQIEDKTKEGRRSNLIHYKKKQNPLNKKKNKSIMMWLVGWLIHNHASQAAKNEFYTALTDCGLLINL